MALQLAVLKDAFKRIGLYGPDQQLPSKVVVKRAIKQGGRKLHFYFNYAAAPVIVIRSYCAGRTLFADIGFAAAQRIAVAP